MNIDEIVSKLHDYYEARDYMKAIRIELLEIAVNDCGLTQEIANKSDVVAYLDGYLAGYGILPEYRKLPNE